MSRRRERLIVEQQRRWRGKSSVGAPFGRVRVRSEPFSFPTKRKKYEQRRRRHVFVRRIRRDQSNPNHVRGDFSVREDSITGSQKRTLAGWVGPSMRTMMQEAARELLKEIQGENHCYRVACAVGYAQCNLPRKFFDNTK